LAAQKRDDLSNDTDQFLNLPCPVSNILPANAQYPYRILKTCQYIFEKMTIHLWENVSTFFKNDGSFLPRKAGKKMRNFLIPET
jgi:hypothetical protein